MGNKNSSGSSAGIGFFGLLGVAFIVLKLADFINWPWVWVLAPIWGSIAFGVLVLVGVLTWRAHK